MSKTTKVYAIEVIVAATAYIRANTEEEAREKVRSLSGNYFEVQPQDGDVCINGAQYDDPELPNVSLSPAMTILEIEPEELDVELVHDDEDE
jgi:hypothetical protein